MAHKAYQFFTPTNINFPGTDNEKKALVSYEKKLRLKICMTKDSPSFITVTALNYIFAPSHSFINDMHCDFSFIENFKQCKLLEIKPYNTEKRGFVIENKLSFFKPS